ncbi:exosome component 10-like [Daphnia carinata]|uniref:exosome component 10-like n=1 Tax=Daphnia carinata TaxID=120202 RepID=UPI00257AD2FA|nr:exosome component 10-like [Daphnia carinata]
MASVVQSNSTSNARSKLKDKADIQKPQVNFKEKINNDPQPFLHKLKEKPYSLNPLSFQERDSHPYEFELENFTPDPIFLDVKNDVPLFPLSKTPLIIVDSTERFEHLLQDLLLQTVIAVDLEHHDSRSYQGITCLMQISTCKSDYIVDTLKLWDQLQPLNQVFCNPKILKIFQAAENDVLWLQRDFGIYVVNLFDTCQAASVLGFERKGLAFLLQHYCQIRISKCYQRADWRIRPLSKEMLNYARGDTHYLIYIYERLKQDLNSCRLRGKLESSIREEGKEGFLEKCQELKSSKANQTTAKNTGVKRMLEVWKNSRSICLRRYKVPPKETYLKSYNNLAQKNKNFNKQQLYALQELCAWRDRVARDEDESPNFVIPNYMLVKITYHLPNNQEGLLHCCSHAPFVQQHLLHIHGIMLKARAINISSSASKEARTTSETKQQYKNDRKRKRTFTFAESSKSRRLTKNRAVKDVSSILKKSARVRKTSRVELTNLACEKKSCATTKKEKPSQSQNM